jgi:hypothetical protein
MTRGPTVTPSDSTRAGHDDPRPARRAAAQLDREEHEADDRDPDRQHDAYAPEISCR